MKLEAVELRHVALPLVAPFRTSFGTQHQREVLLVRARTSGSEGWGECAALPDPVYSAEYLAGAAHVIEHVLLPRLFAAGDVPAHRVAHVLGAVQGHRMAKSALEMALLDAELRADGRAFADELGAVRDAVPCGVSVGIMDSVGELLDAVERYLDDGYVRIKLKIEPGWDLAPVAAVRDRFGDIPLQVDANAAYRLADARHLGRLDAFDLLLIEQPLPEEQVRAHAELARLIRTPICLDESIVSAQTCADAIVLGATAIVNVKPGRVGGYLEARRIHDLCAAHGIPVWCGGMLETGLGRAANVALAAGPNFTLPGDTSASSRFYEQDIVTEALVMRDGHLTVPQGPGLGVTVDHDALATVTVTTREIRP